MVRPSAALRRVRGAENPEARAGGVWALRFSREAVSALPALSSDSFFISPLADGGAPGEVPAIPARREGWGLTTPIPPDNPIRRKKRRRLSLPRSVFVSGIGTASVSWMGSRDHRSEPCLPPARSGRSCPDRTVHRVFTPLASEYPVNSAVGTASSAPSRRETGLRPMVARPHPRDGGRANPRDEDAPGEGQSPPFFSPDGVVRGYRSRKSPTFAARRDGRNLPGRTAICEG